MLLRLYENCLLETGVHGEDIWLGKHQEKTSKFNGNNCLLFWVLLVIYFMGARTNI